MPSTTVGIPVVRIFNPNVNSETTTSITHNYTYNYAGLTYNQAGVYYNDTQTIQPGSQSVAVNVK